MYNQIKLAFCQDINSCPFLKGCLQPTPAVFRMYSPLTSHGYSKSIKAVRRQRNLGLTLNMIFQNVGVGWRRLLRNGQLFISWQKASLIWLYMYRAIHTENSGFASPTLGRHISTFRGYRILFSIRNPYINRFTNHFSIHS
jgi:hypothetical protein